MNNHQQQVHFPKIDQTSRALQQSQDQLTKSNLSLAQSQYEDENERTAFGNFRSKQMIKLDEQKTERNFNHYSQSQGTEIVVELNQKTLRMGNCKEQLKQFLDQYYDLGKIKVIVTFNSTIGEVQKNKIKQKYKVLNISINKTLISEEDKLFSQRIFKFKGQAENNIQDKIEMIIYHQSFYKQFQSIAQQAGGEVIYNWDGLYLQIPPPQSRLIQIKELEESFDTICQHLDNTIILQIECSSNAEATVKHKLLNTVVQQQIERILHFKCQEIVNLKLDFVKEQHNMDLHLQLKHDQLYMIITNKEQSILEQQKKLNEILRSKDIIKKESITDNILFYDLPGEEDEIQKKINLLKVQYPDINIEISKTQALQDQRLQLQITTSTWLMKYQERTEFLKQAYDIKIKIEDIYLPYKIIKMSKTQRITWNNYLQEYFKKYQSCFQELWHGDDMEIALKTNQQKWRELEKQLNEKLSSYTYQIISLEAKSSILKQLKNCQQKNTLFKQVFKKLLIDFEDKCNVTFKEVDEKNIVLLAVFDKRNCDPQKIKAILETQFVSNLDVKQFDFLYKESLEYFQMEVPEQISQNEIFVHQGNKNQTFFVGPTQKINEIFDFLTQLKDKYKNAWIRQEFEVENTVIFNNLQYKYKDIELNLGTKIDFLKDPNSNLSNIIITGFQNQVVDLVKQLSSLESEIKKNYKVKNIQLNNQQIEQFVAKPQQLLQLQENTDSYFEFKSITSFNPEGSILEKLTFEGKELCIVKGDITEINCEAIVYQIMNDKCEFGEVGLQNQQVKNLLSFTNNDILDFFKELMKDKLYLNPGELFYYKVNTNAHVDHIFNIYPPTYRQAKTLDRDQKIIEKLIQNIFKLAKEKNIKQIAFPVISVEIFGFYMNMASQILLKEIINCLFQEDCNIKQIFILENDDSRCKRLLYQLHHLLSDNAQQKTENYVKYQWQWFEQDHFEDYDDYEVNRKICKFYTQFEKGKDQQFNILYPYSKYPGTHLIDLDKQRIWDKTHNNSEQTIISIDNFGERKYYIDGKQVSNDLNRYLIQQEIQGKRKFDIFYKFYEIYLTKEGHYQKNLQFGNIRPIQFIPYEKQIIEIQIVRNPGLRIEKMNLASSNQDNGSQIITFDINQQKQVKYDQVLVHTRYDDENMVERKILELLENTHKFKSRIQSTNRGSIQQLAQVRSPNRKLVEAKRQPLQDKN